ncbi:MAG: type II toxin-antitoxin system RelE/ParE family toxin [Dermatophilaceae bacterium]
MTPCWLASRSTPPSATDPSPARPHRPASRQWRHCTCIALQYGVTVIVSFRHKGLEKLYRDGTKTGVRADHVPTLLRTLSALDVAQHPDDLAIPSFRTRQFTGDLSGQHSICGRELAGHIPVHRSRCRTGRLSGLPLSRKETHP